MDSSSAQKIVNKPLLPTSYSLLPTFQFSQSSLQDFETCPRRFKLRYLDRLRWPAVESEPVREAERLAQLGTDFHRLVQQHVAGLSEEILNQHLAESDPSLRIWWQSYLQYRPTLAAGTRLYPETVLSVPLRGYRLLARFDLLAVQPDGRFLIIDWKTSLHKPERDNLARRMQTHVYPYVLAMGGAAFNNGQPLDPAAIEMIYWYPTSPDQPEHFTYSAQLRQQDEEFLSNLIEQIKHAVQTATFPLVEDKKACTYCVYRSYCDRGQTGGPLAELADETVTELDLSSLDWDQIAEIQF
ncbi:MAG: PD-(D/E)XK nuclease family protein [Anaerolineae bacterium]|nr:PD-(D/E)XK nuclease family protein [Anaerolineae bacterium]